MIKSIEHYPSKWTTLTSYHVTAVVLYLCFHQRHIATTSTDGQYQRVGKRADFGVFTAFIAIKQTLIMMNQDYEPHECVSSCHKIKSVYKLQKNKNSRKAIQYSETVKRRAHNPKSSVRLWVLVQQRELQQKIAERRSNIVKR